MNTQRKISPGKPADVGDFLLERRLRLLRKYIPNLAKLDRVLDYGCGNGAQTLLIAELANHIDALEISPEHYTMAVENLRGIKNIKTHLYDGDKIPFEDNSFDLIYSFEVLEHTQDERKSLIEIHRVLKPGAPLLMTVPNKWWIFETHGANLPYLKWNRVPFFSWLPKSLHSRWSRARIYTKSEISKLLKDTGFRIEHLGYVMA
ncbi:class I SAM-dependent methyltransferase, partial [bacterium]|nr:class I SAM-dependent methyltransferase [bacterium]MBU1025038.1 class I SAM-dependent methyltransferase [bacterium]